MTEPLYGWFSSPDDAAPIYDPPHNAPCPFCGEPIRPDDVRTESFTVRGSAGRSYFFRKHRTCDDSAEQSVRDRITEGVIVRIERELGEI